MVKPNITGLGRVPHPEGTVLVTGDYIPDEEQWLCGGFKGTLDIDVVTPDGDYVNWLKPNALGDVALYWFNKATGVFTDLTDKIRAALSERHVAGCYVNTLAYSEEHNLALIGVVNGRGVGKYALLSFNLTDETFESADPTVQEAEELLAQLDNGFVFTAIRVGTPSLKIDGVEQFLWNGSPLPETWVLVGGKCLYDILDNDWGIAALCTRVADVTHWIDISICFPNSYAFESVAIGEFKSPITDVGVVEGRTFVAAGHHIGVWIFAGEHSFMIIQEGMMPYETAIKNWVVEYNPTRKRWIVGCWYPDTDEKPVFEVGWYSDTPPEDLADLINFLEQDEVISVLSKHRIGYAGLTETELISAGSDLSPETAKLGFHSKTSNKIEDTDVGIGASEWSIDSFPINDTFRFTSNEAILFLTHKEGGSIEAEMITLDYTTTPSLVTEMINIMVSLMTFTMVLLMLREMVKQVKK